jgi:glycogen debranching enzyme
MNDHGSRTPRYALLIALLCAASMMRSQPATVPSFPLVPNDLEILRPAQTGQYFDKIGPRAAVMGTESGTFESWIWPWKPLRNFGLSFLLGTSTAPIAGRDIVRTVSVTPEATVFTYTFESFTVKEMVLVPRSAPGILLLLDVRTTTPLTIVAGFLPVMQPMWPAGIGGQYSYWDDASHAYVISEGQRRATFLCGSPGAEPMATPPAHMFADAPLEFKIDVQPGTGDRGLIPIVIAGGAMPLDSVRTVFTALWHGASGVYGANAAYYRSLRASTLRLTTPRADLNLAFEWGKVALDNLMVRNPNLGYGMVAGYGLSGGGGRPGFAWFFGGDAFINSLTFTGMGAFTQTRDALAFTQQWQRRENAPVRAPAAGTPTADIGKMAHELSQSDGLCDWWNDYHYGYNHADTTPWYLVAMGAYVRASGDTTFLRRIWPSLKLAFDWCTRKDSDGDGLMDLKGAGLGALEFGKLKGIYADVYTCGVWTQGVKEMASMASTMDDRDMETRAAELYARAVRTLEKKFWMEKNGVYSYGVTESGNQVGEITPWPGIALMFGLFDSAHSTRAFETLNSAALCTDWGVRSLAHTSALFEPTNYNYGAVWPFIGAFFNTAQFRHGFSLSGLQLLNATIRHATTYGAGVVPEVFSGALNRKLEEAYHHQGFSTTGYMLPVLSGMLGLNVDALQGTVSLSPQFPADWDSVGIEHIAVGLAAYDVTITQSESTITVARHGTERAPLHLRFTPSLPPGAQLRSIAVNEVVQSAGGPGIYELRSGDRITVTHTPVPVVAPPPNTTAPGSTDAGLKVISCSFSGGRIRIDVEGRSGSTSLLPVVYPHLVAATEGAELAGQAIAIRFESAPGQEFIRHSIFLTPK